VIIESCLSECSRTCQVLSLDSFSQRPRVVMQWSEGVDSWMTTNVG